jgi:hypothetical protein
MHETARDWLTLRIAITLFMKIYQQATAIPVVLQDCHIFWAPIPRIVMGSCGPTLEAS